MQNYLNSYRLNHQNINSQNKDCYLDRRLALHNLKKIGSLNFEAKGQLEDFISKTDCNYINTSHFLFLARLTVCKFDCKPI